ncbi:MAG TPA: carboxypeptidase-like regulatory domain-containing protein [Kofleriaceae bacterium]|nr:carboxypeptidase-like regulatory domain-containing protein [Kofleriaceae bacterium]
MTRSGKAIGRTAGLAAALLAGQLAGCAGSAADTQAAPPASPPPGAGGSGADDAGCGASLTAEPAIPVAGASTMVRITSHLASAFGATSYRWMAFFQGAVADATPVAGDPTQLDLPTPTPGVYDVSLDVDGAPAPCHASLAVNVRAPGARSELLRLRIAAPPSLGAPPYEKTIQIFGGAPMDAGTIAVDPGVLADVTVTVPSGGIAAYLRFAPAGSPDAVVEAYSDHSGLCETRVAPGTHTVLVIPRETDVAPRRFTGWSSAVPTLALDAGLPVTGEVRDRGGALLPGATVRITVDGVPSTVATTGSDGAFALQAPTGAGSVTLEVTPPEGSGLARFLATSSTLDLHQPLLIRYSSNPMPANLSGITVKRAGVGIAADVEIVGTLPVVGSVSAGATTANGGGEVRIAARTDASGRLPAMVVPAVPLSAVIAVAPGDLAVAEFDAGAPPAELGAPERDLVATAVSSLAGRLPGAVLDLVPTGALAMAAAPALHAIADDNGLVTALVAAGGHYDLRFRDPSGRAAPLVDADRTTATIAVSYVLPPALRVQGTVKLTGTQPLAGAAIQFLCDACTGLERTRPIAEGVSDVAGRFSLAVPDPGTM